MEHAVKKSNGVILARIRKFGGHMSGMVMPNLGAFVGWGLIAALFIPNGWFPNEQINEIVGPILNFLFPLLIGYTAGYNIHGQRGGVIGAFATMGVIIGSDVTMISGAMVMGPLSAWVLKKFDQAVQDRIKPGFEMFVNNFSLGIIGAVLTILAFMSVGPFIQLLISGLTAGVRWTTENQLIPLLSVFMAPAQVLFLNNVVNHGILAPIGYAQAAELGKSIMFLVDTNNGPLLGTLLSIAIFGKGRAKNTAPMAMFIAGIAGIGEVYFPFVLANPILLFATMGGLSVSLFLQVLLGGGLIGVASPGSLIAIAMMTPKDAIWANLISILAGFIVSAVIGAFLLKIFGSGEEKADPSLDFNVGGRSVKTVDNFKANVASTNLIKKIIVACDSGMGSSAMGASVLRNRLKKEGLEGITVTNASANKIGSDTDLVITLDSLIERARLNNKNEDTFYLSINNFLKEDHYDEAIDLIKSRNQDSIDSSPVDVDDQEQTVLPVTLKEKDIILNAKFTTQEEAIRSAGKILVEQNYVQPEYIDQMVERNQRLSVYIGNHVAIPHGLEDSDQLIIESGISIIQVPDGVEFDGEIAYVVIGIAGKDNSHLQILSNISLTLMDEENVNKIRYAKSRQEILALFTDREE
ncbi:PTS system, mannitol-specific IIC component [Amphibacillus marinus]|uniref:Mannitol-specific phosphotransferase enzyme IIA component n=1 Tax=Amphibacillus marinus TaxID=872970 RepID=A0A1H8T7X7_9BACI|nr:PTS mannitol transporter subunit IICBA [Amphibacillus marinus]SEO86674.1 PTS system, mannitol-specific IIC component [Amphibacillus marinus]